MSIGPFHCPRSRPGRLAFRLIAHGVPAQSPGLRVLPWAPDVFAMDMQKPLQAAEPSARAAHQNDTCVGSEHPVHCANGPATVSLRQLGVLAHQMHCPCRSTNDVPLQGVRWICWMDILVRNRAEDQVCRSFFGCSQSQHLGEQSAVHMLAP